MFYKLSDFVFKIPPGSRHWPSSMHEPLFIGISLPLLPRNPWSLRGTPLLVELEGQLRQVLSSREEDGGNTLRQLLRTPWQVASVSEGVARKLLQMSWARKVSGAEDTGRGREPMVQEQEKSIPN